MKSDFRHARPTGGVCYGSQTLFSKHVPPKLIKIMTNGRSVDVISGNFS